jgi:hypothetical protein
MLTIHANIKVSNTCIYLHNIVTNLPLFVKYLEVLYTSAGHQRAIDIPKQFSADELKKLTNK